MLMVSSLDFGNCGFWLLKVQTGESNVVKISHPPLSTLLLHKFFALVFSLE